METPWLTLAEKYLGEHEIHGVKDNQFILDCFKHTSYHAGHDEVPWCAAFVCRMLEDSGYKSTNNAGAASYLHYGAGAELAPGAIVVFRWPGDKGAASHVTFCHHVVNDKYVACLGGNQSDMVKISVFPRSCLVGIRLPVHA